MRIGVDLDGVVIDWDTGWRQVWNDLAEQTTIKPRLVPPYSRAWNDPFEDTGLSHGDFWRWIDSYRVYEMLGFCKNATMGLRKLHKAGHEIHFITNRHVRTAGVTAQWLTDHRVSNYAGEYGLHFVRDKSLIEVDAYVDDSPTVLNSLLDSVYGVYLFRQVRPWNSHLDGTSPVFDLKDMAEILEGWDRGLQ